MEITRQKIDDVVELRIKGRLDAYWADHLASALTDVIREGTHEIRLNMSAVTYLSSAGIRVLLQFYKQLKGIQGSFVVSSPSEPVKTVLELTGFGTLLISEATPSDAAVIKPAGVRELHWESATFEIFECTPGASLKCRAIGNPEFLLGCRFSEEHSYTMVFPDSTFAVGLGALGNSFEDCLGRFGEFLAVGGAAAYFPTDGTNVPDYLLAAGTFVPELRVLYCLACEGPFAQMARFDTKKEAGTVTLTEIVDACLDIAGTEVAGIAMVAESAGLMGAALRRSPALHGREAAPFEYPEIQEWLSFTAERTYTRCLTLAVGVAARAERSALVPMIRPLGKEPWPSGHFHAAVFSYRPLKKGEADLKTTVATLFEVETPLAVFHLLNDDREIVGAGESEFVRGACWIGPISEISVERS